MNGTSKDGGGHTRAQREAQTGQRGTVMVKLCGVRRIQGVLFPGIKKELAQERIGVSLSWTHPTNRCRWVEIVVGGVARGAPGEGGRQQVQTSNGANGVASRPLCTE